VPARHGDGPAADHHAGPGGELAADALAEGEGHAPLRAVLAQRRDAGVQEGARVPGGLQEQDVVVLLRDVIAEGAVARRDEVRVGIDESRAGWWRRRSPAAPRRRRREPGPRPAGRSRRCGHRRSGGRPGRWARPCRRRADGRP
jgi:hypothetical protein